MTVLDLLCQDEQRENVRLVLGNDAPPWPATLVGLSVDFETAMVLFPDGSQEVVHAVRVTPFAGMSAEDHCVSASGESIDTLDPPLLVPF